MFPCCLLLGTAMQLLTKFCELPHLVPVTENLFSQLVVSGLLIGVSQVIVILVLDSLIEHDLESLSHLDLSLCSFDLGNE